MKKDIRPVRSVLVTVDLEEVHLNREALLHSCFTEDERIELSRRHVRSTAGRLALKRAVRQIVAVGVSPSLRDIVLGRGPNGRPVLLSLGADPAGPLPDGLFVSISHTRNTAYGLAVLQED
jgi:phosphopantetheinyl transferase (holo-ACP synthase)